MRKREASRIYILMNGVLSLSYSMILTIELVYLAQTVGMGPLQLVLIGTIQQSVCFLLQAPTGVLADMYSRRRVVVIGVFLIGISYFVEGVIPVSTVILLIQIVRGIGVTLMNGADAAWIADEIGAENAGPVYIRASQIGSIASLLGIAGSAALINIHLNIPIVLGGSLMLLLSIALVLVMPERNFTPAPRNNRNSWQQMSHTLHMSLHIVRLKPVLLTILGIAIFYGVFSAGFDQLWQYYLLHRFSFPTLGGLSSATWFCLIEAGIAVTNFVGTEVVRRSVDTNSHRAVAIALFIINGLEVASIIGFALAGQFALSLAAFFLFTTVTAPRYSLEQAWMNQNLVSNVRATVFSLRGQMNSIAQIVGGPLLGLLATYSDTQYALMATGLVLTPLLLFFARSIRYNKPLIITNAIETETD